MLSPTQYRARCTFLSFQHKLDMLEQEMKPLIPLMSIECNFEFETMGKIARSFFRMANEELFSKTKKSTGCEVAR